MFQAPGPFPPQPANPYFQGGYPPVPPIPPAGVGGSVQYVYIYVPYPVPGAAGFGGHPHGREGYGGHPHGGEGYGGHPHGHGPKPEGYAGGEGYGGKAKKDGKAEAKPDKE